MKKRADKHKRRIIASVISIAVIAVIVTTLLIVNIFFPLKYLFAYFVTRKSSSSDGIYMHVIDVGQADCTIVEFPDGKTMLIDGGDGSYSYTYKIIKALNKLDINYIDYLVCSSVNEEHCGGLADIMSVKDVGVIYYPYCVNIYVNDSFRSFYNAATESGAQMVISEYGVGNSGSEGETEYFFTFLSPTNHNNAQSEYVSLNSSATEENMNNASAILWLQCGGSGIFYAGDVQSSVLENLYNSYMLLQASGQSDDYKFEDYTINLSSCALYKVANHGSEDSLYTLLCDLLSPSVSVISVGDNTSGCPSVDVLSDLANHGDIYLTMYAGNITVKVNADGAQIS